MKKVLIALAEAVVPDRYQLPLRFSWLKSIGMLDDEMFRALSLTERRRVFVDIGANMGIYSYFFSKHFGRVEAFEPLREVTYRLRALGSGKVRVHDVALSDRQGTLRFNIPLVGGKPNAQLASLEPRGDPCEVREVEVRTVDSYGFTEVDLMKIDVEGHEEKVIKGALATITSCRPVLLIEIEQRHLESPIDAIFALVTDLGYDGFFMRGEDVVPLDRFDYERDQRPHLDDPMHPDYVNNFIFVPKTAG
ncbi:MAG: FkbM family methyltransferase [Erythrobacter sp.]|uniref:FkbM family methyltransferase n=1 Tax=Erythrobacter sp. TaxID=1042 RepID=UPI0032EDD850